MSVVSRPIIPLSDSPGVTGDPAALWALADAMRHEWSAPTTLTHAWRTQIFEAASGAEARRALWARPRRSVEYRTGSLHSEDVAALLASVLRAGHAMTPAPLWSEKTAMTAPGFPMGSYYALPCPTADRLFFAGQRVIVREPQRGAYAGSRAFLGTIIAGGVLANEIRIAEDPADDFPALSEVIPVIEAEAALPRQWLTETGRHGLTMVEAIEASANGVASGLPALLADGTAPSGAPTFEGLPVFDIEPEPGPSILARRSLRREDVGPGGAVLFSGQRARLSWQLSFVFHTRSAARRLLQWFDGRRGRLRPFWFIPPSTDLVPFRDNATFGGSTYIDVERVRRDDRLAQIPDAGSLLCIVRVVDGAPAYVFARVLSTEAFLVSGRTMERLNLDVTVPSMATTSVIRVAWARRARFDDDELTERWITTRHCTVRLRVTELEREQTVEVGQALTCPPGYDTGCTCPDPGASLCSGHPRRTTPLDTPPAGSATATAMADSVDGFVIGQGAQGPLRISLKGWLRAWRRNLTNGLIDIYYNALWDTELEIAGAPPHGYSGVNLLVPGTFKWYVGAGASPFPSGSNGVLRATVLWDFTSVRTLSLKMDGYQDSSLAFGLWTLETAYSNGVLSSLGGALIPGYLLTPAAGGIWKTRLTQPIGHTSLDAKFEHEANGTDVHMEFAMACHLCPIYRRP